VEAKPGPSEMLRRRFLGQPLMDFSLPQVGGGTIGTEDLRGDVVVIEHFGTWCLVCKSTFQTLRELTDRGAVVLALSSENRPVLDGYVTETSPQFPVLEDYMGRVQRRYDARTVPLLMVVDRDGIIRYIGVGGKASELDLAFEAAQKALRTPRKTAAR
ncbi:MAG: TlpA family protein disulfide reductase, partial [Deltaproteobacteria bacterium]|nr:TlpA family protein disulfide reductase [Deltaproteobacteria bacterium]